MCDSGSIRETIPPPHPHCKEPTARLRSRAEKERHRYQRSTEREQSLRRLAQRPIQRIDETCSAHLRQARVNRQARGRTFPHSQLSCLRLRPSFHSNAFSLLLLLVRYPQQKGFHLDYQAHQPSLRLPQSRCVRLGCLFFQSRKLKIANHESSY